MIADLQVRGYPISATSFLANPTVDALAAQLTRSPPLGGDQLRRSPVVASTRFSSAQRWFYEQDFADRNHWNQAILLEVRNDVVTEALAAAVHDVVQLHPLLRTSYRAAADGWRAEARDPITSYFSVSRFDVDEETAVAAHIHGTARELHASIDLSSARVFAVQLFELGRRPSQLLLVCHHLSVDAVSWRIIVNDLVRLYRAHVCQT